MLAKLPLPDEAAARRDRAVGGADRRSPASRSRDSYTAIEEQNDDSSLLVPYRALTLAARAIADEGVASSWFAQTGSADPPASKALVFDSRNATDEAVKQLRAALPELEGKVRPATLDAVRSIVLRLERGTMPRAARSTRVVDARHRLPGDRRLDARGRGRDHP